MESILGRNHPKNEGKKAKKGRLVCENVANVRNGANQLEKRNGCNWMRTSFRFFFFSTFFRAEIDTVLTDTKIRYRNGGGARGGGAGGSALDGVSEGLHK